MIYFENDKNYWLFWPVIAISLSGEFWIEIGWLNCIFGWRSGDDGGHSNNLQEQP